MKIDRLVFKKSALPWIRYLALAVGPFIFYASTSIANGWQQFEFGNEATNVYRFENSDPKSNLVSIEFSLVEVTVNNLPSHLKRIKVAVRLKNNEDLTSLQNATKFASFKTVVHHDTTLVLVTPIWNVEEARDFLLFLSYHVETIDSTAAAQMAHAIVSLVEKEFEIISIDMNTLFGKLPSNENINFYQAKNLLDRMGCTGAFILSHSQQRVACQWVGIDGLKIQKRVNFSIPHPKTEPRSDILSPHATRLLRTFFLEELLPIIPNLKWVLQQIRENPFDPIPRVNLEYWVTRDTRVAPPSPPAVVKRRIRIIIPSEESP